MDDESKALLRSLAHNQRGQGKSIYPPTKTERKGVRSSI